MDLQQLETFLAVVEERSFSRAAHRLLRTQPAVSQAIRKLEDELGEPLFERALRDGSLTAADLSNQVRNRLPAYMIPEFEFMRALPKSSTGKVDRRQLLMGRAGHT